MNNRSCFVISPIGAPDSDIRKHADRVFEHIIEPAMSAYGISPVRSDQISAPGPISEQMFRGILTADLCVVVLTGGNPNVYYELAVAQCAGRPVILLVKEGDTLPFDVKDLRVVPYDLTDPDRVVDRVDAKKIQDYIASIQAAGWTAPSLFSVYPYGPQLSTKEEIQRLAETVRPAPLKGGADKSYAFPDGPGRKLVILTGSIEEVRDIDVIVNSENTDLQLARFYDPALSGILRYLDAQRSKSGNVIQDCLQEELQQQIERLSLRPLPVQPGTVIATPTHGLASAGIRYIFHLATVRGEIGAGYQPVIERIDAAIRNVYEEFRNTPADPPLQSILFPLIGAGTAKRDPMAAARDLLAAILKEMGRTPQCKVTYLLAWRASHRDAYRQAAAELNLSELA
jgi:O-acetyl-ADP-ribose deacetylase (regulator of RNase III)